MAMDQLYDAALLLVVMSAVLMALCIILTAMRIWVRYEQRSLGLDDYLFGFGLVLWLISTSFIFPACINGFGAHQQHYTQEEALLAAKWFIMLQDFYIWANIPIKSSLCLTLIRLSTFRWVTWTLYFIIFVITTSSIVTNIYLLSACNDVEGLWYPTKPGITCRPPWTTVKLASAYSVINIVIDWVLALLPVVFLWRLQMPWRMKLTVMGVLSLGIAGSCVTLVRLQTLRGLQAVDDKLWYLGQVIIWTILELGLALIAGAAVSLRPLIRRWFGNGADPEKIPTPNHLPASTRTRKNGHFVRTGSQDSTERIGMETIIINGGRGSPVSSFDQNDVYISKGGIRVTKDVEMV